MTLAACYLSSEGVVLGADSTSTMPVAQTSEFMANAYQHYNFGQKVFEIGEKSSIGITTWGLASLKHVSFRTLFARLGDSFTSNPGLPHEKWTHRITLVGHDCSSNKEAAAPHGWIQCGGDEAPVLGTSIHLFLFIMALHFWTVSVAFAKSSSARLSVVRLRHPNLVAPR